MNRILYLFAALVLCLLPATAHAEWYNNITFVVGSDKSAPITVRYDGKTYKVYTSLTINTTGNTYTPSATDANGNSMKYEYSSKSEHRGNNTYHTNVYTFYPRDSYSSGNSGGGYNSESSGDSSSDSWSETGARIGRGLAEVGATRSFRDGGAYPGLHANIGLSKGFGEFCRIRLAAGGFQVYGGVGKDWLFNGENKDKFLWHAGFGGYFGLGEDYDRWGDVSFGLTVAENAAWENLSLTFDVGFNYWFGEWRRIGVFTGAGVGWGDIKDLGKRGHHTKIAWNLELGIAIRLAKF